MTNPNSQDLTVGYCTNVHAGTDLPSIRRNLDEYAVQVRKNLQDDSDLGLGSNHLPIGLWIPNNASQQLVQGSAANDFGAFLKDRGLSAFTINGFPYDNFHQDIVKHRVYLPTWFQQERLDYTKRLAQILSALIPLTRDSASSGSISTLPIGWPNNPDAKDEIPASKQIQVAGENLREMATYLSDLESKTGRKIVVAIEPEPGCILDSTNDIIEFFEKQLPDSEHRRYITVCHDICHSAVMMEKQSYVIKQLATNQIGIGKVQVSSAIVADWEAMADGRRVEAISQLSAFAEDRYLHQTGRLNSAGQFSLVEDLPSIIRNDGIPVDDARWVVHFHVPIFLERFEHLSTSQPDVVECLRTLIGPDALSTEGLAVDFSGHLEIETYAWTVLPESMQKRGLADDISSEFQWLQKAILMCG